MQKTKIEYFNRFKTYKLPKFYFGFLKPQIIQEIHLKPEFPTHGFHFQKLKIL